MQKRTTLISILTLICAFCSLILSTLAFIRSDHTEEVMALQTQNIQLQSQIDKLTTRMGAATESPTYPASSAYCNLVVTEFTTGEVQLVIDQAYVQVQLPQTAASSVSIRRAELVLRLGSRELYQQDISLKPGESEGGYELTIEDLKLPLPELTPEEQLDLTLEVTLSDGQSLQTSSASWFSDGEGLYLIVG